MSEQVGLIGVGLMGHGIARNILASGRRLAFLDHPGNRAVDDLIEAGATHYPRCAELAADCSVIILCVTGSPEVEQVLTSDDGVLAGLVSGTTIIDCSTAIPSSTLKLAGQVEEHGGHFLDAPMTRTPREAEEGRLNLIVGGDLQVFRQQLPLLNCFAENIVHAGAVGSGHSLKLLHNMVSLGFSAVLAEVAACSAHAGIAPDILAEVLAKGGGAGVVFERLKPYLLEAVDDNFRFSLANAGKDTGYYLQMARDLNATEQLAGSVDATYRRFIESGKGDAFVPHLIELLKN